MYFYNSSENYNETIVTLSAKIKKIENKVRKLEQLLIEKDREIQRLQRENADLQVVQNEKRNLEYKLALKKRDEEILKIKLEKEKAKRCDFTIGEFIKLRATNGQIILIIILMLVMFLAAMIYKRYGG